MMLEQIFPGYHIGQESHCFSSLAGHTHFDGTFLEILPMEIHSKNCTYLGVKGISLQFVLALELPSVRLGHPQGVFIPLKDLSLVNFLEPTSREVSFLDD